MSLGHHGSLKATVLGFLHVTSAGLAARCVRGPGLLSRADPFCGDLGSQRASPLCLPGPPAALSQGPALGPTDPSPTAAGTPRCRRGLSWPVLLPWVLVVPGVSPGLAGHSGWCSGLPHVASALWGPCLGHHSFPAPELCVHCAAASGPSPRVPGSLHRPPSGSAGGSGVQRRAVAPEGPFHRQQHGMSVDKWGGSTAHARRPCHSERSSDARTGGPSPHAGTHHRINSPAPSHLSVEPMAQLDSTAGHDR